MFEYCKDSTATISSKIGNFLSHKIKWIDDLGNLLPPEQINEWDRKELANKYLNEYVCFDKYDKDYLQIGGIANKIKFLNDVALKIDELIPKRYFIKYHQINSNARKQDGSVLATKFTDKDNHLETKDLIYAYPTSKISSSEKISTHNYATKKQLSYLSSLAKDSGYLIKNKYMDTTTASELISFLLGTTDDEPTYLFKYLEYE